ncbi:MAG: hypothetical protein CMJ88_05385 [Planctomycetes bacterium]|nr:hypothetical protein [Planctomycetota bacterium]
MVIQCRVLEGFHRVPFARFTSSHTNDRCDREPGMVMIGASVDDRPAALAVVFFSADHENALLESIFVDPSARRLGVGRRLLETAEAICIERSIRTLRGSWYHDAPSASSIGSLIDACGWSSPEETSIVHRAGRRGLEHVDRTNRVWRPPGGFKVESWSELSVADLASIDALQGEYGIPSGLHPEGEPMLAVSESTSVVLRRGDEIVGWMVNHLIGSETLRYSSLWLRPDLVGRGFGISITIESIRRHLAVVDRLPRLIFQVARENDAMHRFVQRRLEPEIERSSTLLRSERVL